MSASKKAAASDMMPALPAPINEASTANKTPLQNKVGVNRCLKFDARSQVVWDDMNMSLMLVYGSVFSIVSDAALYPLDVVKTRLQVQGQVRRAFQKR
jgi:hypothetical protein